jgi:hypothetical protein
VATIKAQKSGIELPLFAIKRKTFVMFSTRF